VLRDTPLLSRNSKGFRLGLWRSRTSFIASAAKVVWAGQIARSPPEVATEVRNKIAGHTIVLRPRIRVPLTDS
jgi:hypothetical protein